jgi:Cu/Ag efflux pump CusA
MIARIIAFSARNPFLVVLLIAAILAGGIWATYHTPLDALPDLSDVQVIVYTPWADRSPDIVEDQVTYPIVPQLLSAPKVRAVRASTFFGFSLVYVIFEDGTDLNWARSRVLEYLSGMGGQLPSDATPRLGPDATGVGWGLEYVLIDRTGKHELAQLRTRQDWYVRYQLLAVPGVSEIAPVGAFVKQYQVTLDPDLLLAYKIPVNRVVGRIRQSNQEIGGRVVEFTGREYMVRGRGYFKSPADIEQVSLGAQPDGTPIRARAMVEKMVELPPGYHLEWSGSYKGMKRAGERLAYVIPLTLLVIFVLFYLNTLSLTKVLIVFLAVPFSLVGAFVLLDVLPCPDRGSTESLLRKPLSPAGRGACATDSQQRLAGSSSMAMSLNHASAGPPPWICKPMRPTWGTFSSDSV